MLRNLMLKAAARPFWIRLFVELGRKSGLSRRFVAGQDFGSALAVVQEFNQLGISTSLDLLGEGVRAVEHADKATRSYIDLLDRIQTSGIDSNISVKLTQLGLEVDRELCGRNLEQLLHKGAEVDNFVRIDMEGSRHTEATLELFKENVRRFGPKRLGIVLQSYLYRTEKDVAELAAQGCNIRICKGAYREPEDIAFPDKADVDDNFIKMLKILFDSPTFTAIASHDDRIIQAARQLIDRHDIANDRYEFQMLYGVGTDTQIRLRHEGHRVRVYVPFGTEWAPYFMRRLAERPANMLFVAKAILRN